MKRIMEKTEIYGFVFLLIFLTSSVLIFGSTLTLSTKNQLGVETTTFYAGDELWVFGTAQPNQRITIWVTTPTEEKIPDYATANSTGAYEKKILTFDLSSSYIDYGTYIVKAVTDTETQTINVTLEAIASVKISSKTFTGYIGETQVFTVKAYDSAGNEVKLTPEEVSWSTSIGELNATTGLAVLFNATRSGTGTITVTVAGLSDTAFITVKILENPIVLSTPTVTNSAGVSITSATKGSQVIIATSVTNNDAASHTAWVYLRIDTAAGAPWFMFRFKFTFTSGQTLPTEFTWMPDKAGNYTIRIMVLDAMTGVALGPEQTIAFTATE